MKHRIAMLLGIVSIAAAPAAHSAPSQSPGKSDPERARILNIVRPFAEGVFGPPVEFVVRELTVSGEWTFVRAVVQRKGGRKIAWVNTPHFKKMGNTTRTDIANALSALPECCGMEAILQKDATRGWRVIEQKATATDVWWESYCDKPARVAITKWCTGR